MKIEDILKSKCGLLNSHLQQLQVEKKRHKYGAQPVLIDGHRFASKKEAGRYLVLRRDVALGVIKDLRMQVGYQLNNGGTHSLKYIADFVYIDTHTGLEIVEDAKGFKTKEYNKKKRLMLQVYNIEIKEV